MKYTYLEPNSKFSKEWADYTKSWQLLKKKQQKLSRHPRKTLPARHPVPSRPSFSVFSVQDIKKAAINHSLYTLTVMKKD
jgi:hypothetical protein